MTGVCPVAGCDRHLAPAKPLCYAHWQRIPPEMQHQIQDLIWQRVRSTEDDLFMDDQWEALMRQAIDTLTPPVPEPLE